MSVHQAAAVAVIVILATLAAMAAWAHMFRRHGKHERRAPEVAQLTAPVAVPVPATALDDDPQWIAALAAAPMTLPDIGRIAAMATPVTCYMSPWPDAPAVQDPAVLDLALTVNP